MDEGESLYEARPDLYDVQHDEADDDLDYYADLAGEAGGAVLELGCGTGRILAALVAAQPGRGRKARRTLVGLDRSPAMLRAAQSRLSSQPGVVLEVGDLRNFTVAGGPFALITCALNTFMELLTPEDQLACLARCAAHLAPGGTLVLDLLNPYDALGDAYRGQVLHQFTRHRPDGSFVALATSSLTDGSAQYITTYRQFDEWGAGRPLTRSSFSLTTRYTFRYELEHLLARAGLALREVQGDYEGNPWGEESPRLISLASA